jgi:alkylation response protein AidB-like acyl-CoA dehydrogenase
MGGQGAPTFLGAAAAEYFMGANWPLFCYATMGNGTANMIQLYGSPHQKETYVKKLTSAEWGGTMLLTESEAGSDVGALSTLHHCHSEFGRQLHVERQQDLYYQWRT